MSRLSPRIWMICIVLAVGVVGTCFAAVDDTWNLRDLWQVLIDWRLWPLVLIYFSVVGVGIGTQLYGSVIISAIDPAFTVVNVSLLFAPIWMTDFFAILRVTPVSDRFHRYHAIFSVAVCIQIAGLLNVTFTLSNSWNRCGGLLMVGLGRGRTVLFI
ncbi:hypothetical protein P885DRAFT_61304 [Corynascus similis CBS 632.67]